MTRKAKNEGKNRYYQARLEAGKENEKLLTRVGAVDLLPGVSEDSLKKYELGINQPPNIVVAMMAEAYIQPELRHWYCANECPLGKDRKEVAKMPPERALIRLENSLGKVNGAIRALAMIMEDGELDEEELKELPGIRQTVLNIRHRCNEVLVALERAGKTKRF